MREPRVRILLLALALVAVPAIVLRARCPADGCGREAPAAVRVPFCALPASFRQLVVAGFRDGRSPDVLAATGAEQVDSGVGSERALWPTVTDHPPEVPIAFLGSGVRPGALPLGTSLDRIAPTLEQLLDVRRPFPDVRSGTAVDGVGTGGASPLAVVIVWKGVGSEDLRAGAGSWPWLRDVVRAEGAATMEGTSGSLPVDPAAVLTTIGTGGLPSQHGITGSVVRADDGRVVRAFGPGGPTPVISSFAEDLDRAADEEAEVALVAASASDRGLIGGSWYRGADHDHVVVAPQDPVTEVERLLDAGYGDDIHPDVIALVLEGSVGRMDRTSSAVVDAVLEQVLDATVVVTATGSEAASRDPIAAGDVIRGLERSLGAPASLVADVATGGLFLDEATVASSGIGADAVATAMLEESTPGGTPLFADAYPAYSVALARYC